MEYKTSEGETRSNLKEPASIFDHSSNIRPNTFGVFNLAGMFWRGKWIILTLAFVAFITALILASASSFREYSKQYEYIVQLTFSGVENNTYPNGTKFSISDITAPAVLNEVYKNNQISDFGIPRHVFANMASITPFAPNRQFILFSFESVFNKRKASLAELEEAQKNINQKLKEDARRAAVLRFTVRDNKLSRPQVSSILADIVTTWAKKAVDERGVAEFVVQSVRHEELDETKFVGLVGTDLLNALVVRFNSLQKYVTKLTRLPGANRAKDPETGSNINHLSDQMMEIRRSIENYPSNWTLEEKQLANTGEAGSRLNLYKSFSDAKVYSSQLQYFDLINSKRALVASNTKILESVPFGANVVDSINGTTALDISQTIRELKQFDLENLRTLIVANNSGLNCQANIDYLNVKLNRLNREFQLVNKNAKISTDAQNIYISKTQNSSNFNNLTSGNGSVDSETISPQLSAGFIDKLIALNESSGDRKFREKLIRDTIEYRKTAAILSIEIETVNTELAILQNNEATCQNTVIAKNSEKNGAVLNTLNSQMNEYGRITNRISARLQLASAIVATLENGNKIANDSTNPNKPKASKISNYLRGQIIPTITLSELITNLRGIAKSANNIQQLVGEETYGNHHSLFEPISGVNFLDDRSFFSTRWLYVIIALTLAGLLLGMAFVFFLEIRSNKRTPLRKNVS